MGGVGEGEGEEGGQGGEEQTQQEILERNFLQRKL
jgi:hypothetical protein